MTSHPSLNNEILLRRLISSEEKIQQWLDQIPDDIKVAFYDNFLVNELETLNQLFVDYIFPDKSWINWFLHDWSPGGVIESNDKVYTINNTDDFIEFLKVENLLYKETV
jgi:hypothetical protein